MAVAVHSDLSRPALADALDANVTELWRLICAALPDAQFHEDEDAATWFTSGSDVAPWLNQVLRVDCAPDDVGRTIDRLLAAFAARGVASMYWSVSQSTRPAHLASLLEARGLVRASQMPGMALELDALPDAVPTPDGLTIDLVRDSDALAVWASTYVAAFEMDERAARPLHDAYARAGFAESTPLRHYVGVVEGRPVASATFFFGAGVAGVWHIGTLRSERRRGIGAAITLAGLRDARALGYRAATLYASQDGIGVYRRLGFRDCNEVAQYTTENAS